MNPASHLATMLSAFRPTRDFFVGIDSDGCAMDAMEIKHQECFIPASIKVWELQPISTVARQTAIFVNLGSITRGLNRWLALKQLLDLLRDRVEVSERGVTIPEYPELTDFINSSYPLSDVGVAEWAAANPSETANRMMAWDKEVNSRIADMVNGAGPFPGVRDAMTAMARDADLMTVSATPVHALTREWTEYGLVFYVQLIAGQEMGSKADHVRHAAKGKYPDDHILVIGDAPGDRDAAAKVGVLFYPILPTREQFSWTRLRTEAFPRFLAGSYAGDYQRRLIDEFSATLSDHVAWETISGNRRITMPKVK